MKDDPIVAEVRRVRDQLARKFNYDIHAIFEDLRRRQGRTAPPSEKGLEPPAKRTRRSAAGLRGRGPKAK